MTPALPGFVRVYDPSSHVWEIKYKSPGCDGQPPDARIFMAAVRRGDRVFIGWRHGTIMPAMARIEKLHVDQNDQGFIDNYGCFYSRTGAAALAYLHGQISKIPSTLFSEDLWDNDGTPRPPDQPFNPAGDKPRET